jgi:hypothetical protein
VGTGRERIDGRAQLAETLGLSENALRHRAQRLRNRLRVCAGECIERSGSGGPSINRSASIRDSRHSL